jgi:hypothetical protein
MEARGKPQTLFTVLATSLQKLKEDDMRKVGYLASALLLLAVALGPAFAQQPFSDVPTNHWAYNAVNALAEQGLLEGYPDGTFQGKQSLTRYEFAQAVARMIDRMEQMGGVPGPPGPPGPPGASGAGAGLTPEQKAMLDKLAKEFGPELKALRSDVDALTARVEDLEAAPKPEMPKVTVDGLMSWRVGLYGTEFGTEDVDSTGYPLASIFSMYGVGNTFVPIVDSLKDAYKAGDFMSQRTVVNFNADLSESVGAKVSLLAGPETNQILHPGEGVAFDVSPVFFSGSGLMDTVVIDQAWVEWKTKCIVPANVVVGKQYFGRGQGLLADNDQEAIKAFKIDWATDSWSFGALWGMVDREQFFGASTSELMFGLGETNGQDNYNLYSIDWAISDSWGLGGSWLESGFNEERGWSVDLAGKAWGLDWYGEYAQLLDWPTGEDFFDLDSDGVEEAGEVSLDDSDTAWLTGLKWSRGGVSITGEYGEVDAGYALSIPGAGWSQTPFLVSSMGMYDGFGGFNLPLSALHPNASVDPHDINWIDRQLFLDPTNIARGWHVNVTFPELLGEGTPLSIDYADGDGYSPEHLEWLAFGGSSSGVAEPDEWRDADAYWTVKLSRQFTETVSANILYSQREVDNILAVGDYPGEDDPIKVIRGEISVAF